MSILLLPMHMLQHQRRLPGSNNRLNHGAILIRRLVMVNEEIMVLSDPGKQVLQISPGEIPETEPREEQDIKAYNYQQGSI